MKGRESGMPEESYWESFYDADCIVEKLECAIRGQEIVAEFGCGYGTFTLPVASRTSGVVHTFDIESGMVTHVRQRAHQAGLANVCAEVRDFVTHGTGLASHSIDHAMVFNLLHIEEPVRLLEEAFRVTRPGGRLSVIHWRDDVATPRGPSMDIRPSPGQCRAWAEAAGFSLVRHQDLSECCRYHYGLILTRGENRRMSRPHRDS
jgi:SAM-dependent methyltransferase